jgi:hypothetical protein
MVKQKNRERKNNSAPVNDSLLKSKIFRKHLENCIKTKRKSGSTSEAVKPRNRGSSRKKTIQSKKSK